MPWGRLIPSTTPPSCSSDDAAHPVLCSGKEDQTYSLMREVRDLLLDSLVRSLIIVERNMLLQNPFDLTSANQQIIVQCLSSHGSEESFHDTVHIGRFRSSKYTKTCCAPSRGVNEGARLSFLSDGWYQHQVAPEHSPQPIRLILNILVRQLLTTASSSIQTDATHVHIRANSRSPHRIPCSDAPSRPTCAK
jgi:hypothetical protein